MFIGLPNCLIDTDNITPDFEDVIKKSFAIYTRGTNPAYMYQDKLSYLDAVRRAAHNCMDTGEAVRDLIKDKFAYELEENGEIAEKEDFYSIEFMEECFEQGFLPFYSRFYSDKQSGNEKVMKVLLDIVKIVVNYEEGDLNV